MCLSARCVLVCCCTAGTCALSHLAGTVLPTPVHGHTASMGPTAPRVLCYTISTLCAVPQCLVLCSALHCVCLAALHLWAVGSGQWAAEILQCTASLLAGSGQWSSCFAPPHHLEAVGCGTPATHCLTALGPWAVQLLQNTASLPGGSGQCNSSICTAKLTAQGQWAVELLQCTVSLLRGSGQRNSCNALPHCLWAVGSGAPALHRHNVWGSGLWNSYNALPHCLGVVGSGTPINALPYCLGAVGSATPVMHCLTACGQWAVELLLCTATLFGGSGLWNSCNALPHCLGALGSGTPVMHRHTA